MARYIEAVKTADIISEKLNIPLGDLVDVFGEIPTSDVEEVRHGEWKLKSEIRQLLCDIDEKFYVECPICHRIKWVPYMLTEEKMLEYANEHYPYCHCGAKMDGGKTE